MYTTGQSQTVLESSKQCSKVLEKFQTALKPSGEISQFRKLLDVGGPIFTPVREKQAEAYPNATKLAL